MSAPHVRVRVVGACEITVGRMRIGPDAAVLFALVFYLTVRAGERIGRAELLEFLWAGVPNAGRKHALRQLVYRLRKAGLDIGDASDLTIPVDSIDSDLNTIRSEAWASTVLLGDIPHPSTVLAGCNTDVSEAFGGWLETVRAESTRNLRRAALRHMASARREGRWTDVENMARLCLVTDPLHEEGTLALAEATMMGGSRTEALRILDAYLWEIGHKTADTGLPAKLLRRRMSQRQSFRISGSHETPLVGRSADLAWLNDQVATSPHDSTRCILLVGASGVGKTALIRAFTAQLELSGWRVAETRLQPSDVSRPMGLISEMLLRLMKLEGALGAAPESMVVLEHVLQNGASGAVHQRRLQDIPAFSAKLRMAISDLVGAIAHEGPLAMVLEDLHWIDTQSLIMLEWMLERIAGKPVLLLLSTRPESQGATLRRTLAPLRVAEHQVTSLGVESSQSLFAALAGEAPGARASLTEHAFSLTGGNPLFIRNLAADASEGGPATALPRNLRDLIRGRVNRFSPTAQRVLHACAMLGRYASAHRVARVLEMPTAELLTSVEELESIGLLGLGNEPGSLALHDLWQDELLAGLRPASKALLHLRCGEVLEPEASATHAADIVHDAARHLSAAGATGRALALLEASARSQLDSGCAEAAVESSRRALQVANQSHDRARVRELHLRALQRAGDWHAIASLATNP